jgi:hypothetical protein
MKQQEGASGLHLGVRGRLDAVFRALSDLQQTGNISARGGYSSRSSTSMDGQGAVASSLGMNTGLGRVLGDALRQLLAKAQASKAPNSCSSLAHVAAGGTGMVDVRDLPALLSMLLPGLAHKEIVELAAWLRAGSQQQQQQQQAQQQQGLGAQGMTIQELEAAVRGLLEASECSQVDADTLHPHKRMQHLPSNSRMPCLSSMAAAAPLQPPMHAGCAARTVWL